MGLDSNRKPNLKVNLASIEMKNPVMSASGTFGSGHEYSKLFDISKLGAIVTKAVTLEARGGNPLPRIYETPSGMLNAIGLQNKGVERFIQEDLGFLTEGDLPVIVNVAGDTMDDYVSVAERLSKSGLVRGLEINISCPNVKRGGMAFGHDPKEAATLTSLIRRASDLPLIVKLTPNVGEIEEIARAVEASGADAVSLINTLVGMAIDVDTFKPRLANVTGGLSGPAIRPVAVAMVYRVAKAVKIPIIGMGGITTAQDAIEFFLAGATAVAIGTANFTKPSVTLDIIKGIEEFLEAKGIREVSEIVGQVRA
ncbi:MAG: dihydroorotate dehydrogenase [Actinomycetota bacterium]|nr:dihydroorotate dehydrogenase [Actinomycetota bacterium]